MAVGTGIGFNFSDLVKQFDKLDKQLDKLIQKGKGFETTMVDAFKNMTKSDFKKFSDGLKSLRADIVDFGKHKVGIKWDSASLQNYIDNVNRLIYVIKQVRKDASKSQDVKGISILGLRKEVKDAQELLRLVKKAEQAYNASRTSRNQTYSGAIRYSNNANTLEKERIAIENLKAARDKLRQSDANYATKLNALNDAIQKHEKHIKDASKTDKQRADEAVKNAKKIADAQARYDSISRRERYKAYTTSYEGAIRTSDKANTIAQEIQAVRNLEAARAKLNKTDADYQKKLDDINSRILQHNKNIRQATDGAKELDKAHSKLGTAIASVFSIQAIRGYVNQMIKVRGEMELQQRSLQAILQNKAEANEIWQKTIDLAVRSPFRIKDLVTYTKQLAAYRVEADKLYDTNKMLADVSAGLGVDMNRLILAFGQVKSANFLRGTELRQFTEAGIPMLDALAKLYSEMENATVTSADVFERISKRMVLFEDVEEVFKRMTQAGGTFYRMQEVQAETLKGQISNLKDSVDIMLNSMGEATDGVLKKSVKAVKFLVDNYKSLIPVIKAVIAALALYKINSFAASEATLRMARSMKLANISAAGLGGAWTSMRVGLAKLWKALGKTSAMLISNPWLLLIAAVGAAAVKLKQFKDELDEVNKKYQELLDKQEDVYLEFRRSDSKGSIEEQIAEKRKQLQAFVDMASNEYGITLDIRVGDIDESQLDNEFNKVRQKLIELNAFSAAFAKEMIIANADTKWDDFATVGIFEEGLFEDIEDVGDSYEKLYQRMVNSLGRTTAELRDKWEDLTDSQRLAIQDLEKPIQADESMIDYVERLKEAYKFLLDERIVKNNKILRFIKSFDKDISEAETEFSTFANRFRETVESIADEEKKIEFLDVSIGAMADEKKWSEFEEEYIRKLVEKEFEITFAPKVSTPDTLKAWQESYNKLFEGKAGFREITAAATSQAQVIERLQGTYDSLKETIERIEAAGADSVLTGGAYEGQSLEALKKDLAEVTEELAWFGIVNSETSGKDTVLEKLKSQISIIKEMNKEYEKLNKTYSKTASLQKVMTAYADTAKELGLDTSKMDFSDKGTIASLEKLLSEPQYAANKYAIELKKALDNFVVEVDIEAKQDADKRLVDSVQKIFDQYDLSLELKKLNIPPSIGKSLFKVDYLDLAGLKKKVQEQSSKFIGTDMEDEYKKFLDKIDDMEKKDSIERMKTYSKYLMEGMSERVKLKIEELKKLKEVEESKEFQPDEKKRIKAQISQEARSEQDKQAWKDFQGTEMYTMMFEDLEFLGTKALEALKTKLTELKSSLKDLPADEVKEIINQISKIEDITIQRNPFASLRDAMKEVKALQKEGMTEDVLQKTYIEADAKRSLYQEELDAIELIINKKSTGIDLTQQSAEWQDKYAEYLGMTTDELNVQAIVLRGNLMTQKNAATTAKEGLDAYADARKSLSAVANEWGTFGSLANKAWDSAKTIMESLGIESDSLAMTIGDTAMSMVDLVFQGVQFGIQLQIMSAQAKILGVEMNAALGPIGWVVLGLQAVATLIQAIFGAKDKALQKQIEASQKDVEELQKKYEELEESIENAWNVESIKQYNKDLQDATKEMIKAQEAAIAAQEQRKGANKEGSDAYNELQDMYNELDEMEMQLAESLEDSFSKVTDGILDSVHDAAKEFTDAWYEAYKEAGDGLKGLEENFEEMFLSLAKNQAAMQITGVFVDQWKKELEKYINAEDTKLTIEDAKKWAASVKESLPELSAALESYFDAIGDVVGGDGSGLSALEKGISGITEDQADVLAAYWNASRMSLSSIDSKMDLILANMGVSSDTENNPMLVQLRTQTGYIKTIRDIMEGTTRETSAIYVRLAN